MVPKLVTNLQPRPTGSTRGLYIGPQVSGAIPFFSVAELGT
jgi:hypothetical protein